MIEPCPIPDFCVSCFARRYYAERAIVPGAKAVLRPTPAPMDWRQTLRPLRRWAAVVLLYLAAAAFFVAALGGGY